MKTILFICSGNTCRSPMAAALAKAYLEDNGSPGELLVLSAGVDACPGCPATIEAVGMMAERGLDLTGHRSTFLTKGIIEEAGIILVMTPGLRQRLLKISPDSKGKVFTLGEYAGIKGDVPDPFGSGMEAYRWCAAQLDELVWRAMERALRDFGEIL